MRALNRGQDEEVLELMMHGAVVQAGTADHAISGEYIVGLETVAAILALAEEKRIE